MPLKTHLDDQPTLNLTPMIDIVFLLIIFFMVGTKFTELERNISLQVPEVSEAGPQTAAPRRRVINVFGDGSVLLDRQTVTLEELTAELSVARGEYKDLGVIVRGDAETPFQNVAQVLGACRAAHISEMGISVRLASRER